MSKSADASPRVAEKMAKTKAHLMMLHANQTTHALKTDKAWSNSLAEREVLSARGMRESSARLVSRAREEARRYDVRTRDLQEEQTAATSEVISRVVNEERRKQEEQALSARKEAQQLADQYARHQADVNRRAALSLKLAQESDARLKKQLAAQEEASKRAEQLRKAREAALAEKGADFAAKRDAFVQKRDEDRLAAATKTRKEFAQREATLSKRSEANEANKQAELRERTRTFEEHLASTSRAHAANVAEKNRKMGNKWDEEIDATNARLDEMLSARSTRASEHRERNRQTTLHNKEMQQQQHDLKQEGLTNEMHETNKRLESLQSARDQRDFKELNSIRSEYHLKSEIEELGWEAAVKKADPGAVRTGLSAIKAPIPRGC